MSLGTASGPGAAGGKHLRAASSRREGVRSVQDGPRQAPAIANYFVQFVQVGVNAREGPGQLGQLAPHVSPGAPQHEPLYFRLGAKACGSMIPICSSCSRPSTFAVEFFARAQRSGRMQFNPRVNLGPPGEIGVALTPMGSGRPEMCSAALYCRFYERRKSGLVIINDRTSGEMCSRPALEFGVIHDNHIGEVLRIRHSVWDSLFDFDSALRSVRSYGYAALNNMDASRGAKRYDLRCSAGQSVSVNHRRAELRGQRSRMALTVCKAYIVGPGSRPPAWQDGPAARFDIRAEGGSQSSNSGGGIRG